MDQNFAGLPEDRLNPYFIGLSILIKDKSIKLFRDWEGLNPYFIGLSILIIETLMSHTGFIVVSILILLDYLFLCVRKKYKLLQLHKVSILILLDYLFLSSSL